jgi:release factor glutamine methyltransferase
MKLPSWRRIVRFIESRTLKPYLQRHLRKPRRYRFRDVELVIPPGVFHPGLFFSTRFLIEYLDGFDLRGKSLWELGCGSGLISILAAQRGARVTASDVNPVAVANLREDARRNRIDVETIESDLFAGVPVRQFDWIVINPPYYRKHPQNMAQQAWNAGERYEYFERLFAGLGDYLNEETVVCMVLSDACDVPLIRSLAQRHGLTLEQRAQKRLVIEDNWIFHVVPRRA